MGGTALKTLGIESSRLDLDTYNQVKSKVSEELSRINLEHYIPIEYSDKTSFGDIDILVLVDSKESQTRFFKFIQNYKYTKNSTVYSTAYQFQSSVFQVDFIAVSNRYSFESSKHYLNYDNSQVLGVIFRRAGFKLKPQGLYMYSSKISRDLFVTGNYQRLFAYLILSYKDYINSLKKPFTFEQYIQFVAKSPFFDYRYFQLDQLSSRRRIRLRKRKSYMKFLDIVNTRYKKEETFSSDILRQRILHDNPRVLETYENEYLNQIIYNEIKEKFNGKLVMKYTNLESGPMLGKLMQQLKHNYNSKFWLTHSDLEIMNVILKEYKKLKERV